MSDVTRRLHDELDTEIGQLSTSADPAGADEPELEPYSTRLRSLHDAVVAQERGAGR